MTTSWPIRCCTIFTAALVLGWLVPDHYPPWTAFHSDWLAAAGLMAAATLWAFTAGPNQRTPRATLYVACVAFVPLLQWSGGIIFFLGDALMASTYLLGFALSVQFGYQIRNQATEDADPCSPLLLGILLTGMVCVGLAMSQWLSLDNWLGTIAIPLPRGMRPWANFAQSNQLATFLVWAIAAALWLHERGRLGSAVLYGASALSVAGIVLTQSRAGSVELLLLLVGMASMRRRASLRVNATTLVAVGATLLLLTAALPWAADALLIAPPARTAAHLSQGGTRPVHWAVVGDAILRSPWVGYGWNQVSVAVSRVVTDYPSTHEMIEHSHNLVLDLFVWNGIPLGLLLVLGVAVWLVKLARQIRHGADLTLLAIVLVTLVHSLFEFPLEYAYMLFPIGILLGYLEAKHHVAGCTPLPKRISKFATVFGASWSLLLGYQYLAAEANYRAMRFESARIGSGHVDPHTPNLFPLTQLQAFIEFARSEVGSNFGPNRLKWMERVAERYGYAPVLFRYAIAAGRQGNVNAATHALVRICKQAKLETCEEAKRNWALLQRGRFPELGRIPFP